MERERILEEIAKTDKAARDTFSSHDISWQEYLLLIDSAINEPETKAGKLAWTILGSIFDEIQQRKDKL